MEVIRNLVGQMGQRELAQALGCSPSLVSHWVTGRKRITAERARQIEDVTLGGVTRYDLRPDVFGPAPAAAHSDQSEAA